ncbi:hypothetical protein M434DRAFT_28091 [Hypoxylon sp. CO27-5]|nr:hypothetical protein M434DRAFT_28091 [Hypoxylon sp. CO27-5]
MATSAYKRGILRRAPGYEIHVMLGELQVDWQKRRFAPCSGMTETIAEKGKLEREIREDYWKSLPEDGRARVGSVSQIDGGNLEPGQPLENQA